MLKTLSRPKNGVYVLSETCTVAVETRNTFLLIVVSTEV